MSKTKLPPLDVTQEDMRAWTTADPIPAVGLNSALNCRERQLTAALEHEALLKNRNVWLENQVEMHKELSANAYFYKQAAEAKLTALQAAARAYWEGHSCTSLCPCNSDGCKTDLALRGLLEEK